nr:YheC/YheD family protein [Aneurinibacillus tyrosinisolvens]
MGKYGKFKWFSQSPSVRPHLPNTAICNQSTLKSYLHKYKTVFIKPDVGARGIGIIKAWKNNSPWV